MRRPPEVPAAALAKQKKYLKASRRQWNDGHIGGALANHFLSERSFLALVRGLGLWSQDWQYRGSRPEVNRFVDEVARRRVKAWYEDPAVKTLRQAREQLRARGWKSGPAANRIRPFLSAVDELREAANLELPPARKQRALSKAANKVSDAYEAAQSALGVVYTGPDACGRCAGMGRLESYRDVDGGVCYECGGSGEAPH